MLLIVREADATATIGRAQHLLSAGDTLLLDHAEQSEVEIAPDASAQLYAIDLWRT